MTGSHWFRKSIAAATRWLDIHDPFFLIEYDPAHVHFAPIPAIIGDECPEMRGHYVRAWVYGHLKTPEAEYFIVDGYVKIESEDRPGAFSVVPEDGSGFLIEIRAGKCLVDPTPYVFFPELNKAKSRIRVPDSVLDAISSELLKRYAKSFGGKRAFLQTIHNVKREAPSEPPQSVGHFRKATGERVQCKNCP
jgi:hypothetical protein